MIESQHWTMTTDITARDSELSIKVETANDNDHVAEHCLPESSVSLSVCRLHTTQRVGLCGVWLCAPL